MKYTFSIWERESFLTCDVLLVGAGITGLSAAAKLKETHPKLEIVVLERGLLPTGASTKNAGFACFGSVSELLIDLAHLGEEGMLELVNKRIRGLDKTIARLGKQAIDLQSKGGFELIFDEDAEALNRLDEVNRLLQPLYKEDVYKLSNEKRSQFGFAYVHSLIENRFEGQLDTGKLMKSLRQYCSSMGISIYTGCEVQSLQQEASKVRVECQEIAFSARKVGICTNAFSNKLLAKPLDLEPGRGLVLSVVPQKPLRVRGTFHYEAGYYYFRDYYGRLIFGGGRNLDLEREQTTEFGTNERIKDKLIHDLKLLILPNQPFEVEMEWSGIMAFGKHKKPITAKVAENLFVGARLGGMGVAIGSLVGEEVATLIGEEL